MSLTDFLVAAELADDDTPLCLGCDTPLTALEDARGALLCSNCLPDEEDV